MAPKKWEEGEIGEKKQGEGEGEKEILEILGELDGPENRNNFMECLQQGGEKNWFQKQGEGGFVPLSPPSPSPRKTMAYKFDCTHVLIYEKLDYPNCILSDLLIAFLCGYT